jgi:hypothetical protein
MTERPTYQEALRRTNLLRILAPFDPHVVSTLPLGVARPGSDIDIVCCATDRSSVATLLWGHFRDADDIALYQWSARGRPVVAKLSTYGHSKSSSARLPYRIKLAGGTSRSRSDR